MGAPQKVFFHNSANFNVFYLFQWLEYVKLRCEKPKPQLFSLLSRSVCCRELQYSGYIGLIKDIPLPQIFPVPVNGISRHLPCGPSFNSLPQYTISFTTHSAEISKQILALPTFKYQCRLYFLFELINDLLCMRFCIRNLRDISVVTIPWFCL